MRALVFGVGSGTLGGNNAISNAIVEGIFLILKLDASVCIKSDSLNYVAHFSNMLFLRTMALRGVA